MYSNRLQYNFDATHTHHHQFMSYQSQKSIKNIHWYSCTKRKETGHIIVENKTNITNKLISSASLPEQHRMTIQTEDSYLTLNKIYFLC